VRLLVPALGFVTLSEAAFGFASLSEAAFGFASLSEAALGFAVLSEAALGFAAPSAIARCAAPEPAATETIAARYGQGGELTIVDFERSLASRYAKDTLGREAFDHLVRERVLDREIERRGFRAAPEELERALAATEAQLRARDGRSIEDELRSRGMDRETFVDLFRKHLACERFARDDLRVPADEEVRPDQQELWLRERAKAARVERSGLPEGVLATVDGAPIRDVDLGRALRLKMSRSEVRDAIVAAVGIRLVSEKARDLAVEATPADVEAAIDRRRERFASHREVEGVGFEQFLQARGLSVDDLRADPGVRGEAVLAKVAMRLYPDAEVDRRYEAECDAYDGVYGAARLVSWILLHAAHAPNALISRTYDEADGELRRLAERATSPAEFARLASAHSMDGPTRERGGEIGWLHRRETGRDAALLQASFEAKIDVTTGPVRTSEGSCLLLVRSERPAPTLGEMRSLVRDDLASRLYRSMLRDAKIATYVDAPREAASSAPTR